MHRSKSTDGDLIARRRAKIEIQNPIFTSAFHNSSDFQCNLRHNEDSFERRPLERVVDIDEVSELTAGSDITTIQVDDVSYAFRFEL